MLPTGRLTRSRFFWIAVSVCTATLVALPIAEILFYVGQPSDGTWQHLRETVLFRYVSNTVILALGVALATLLIGVGCAWLVTMCDFPCKGVLRWALLLPLAIPPYLMAYALTDLLQYSGPVQTHLREYFQWTKQDYWFPEIRSLPGAITILTLSLYPYVYLAARTAFVTQSLCVIEASRTLGAGAWATFFRVALPLARPAIAAGCTLVMMETVAEFGAVDYCAVDTLSTGIYRTWMSRGSLEAAAQLSTCLLMGVVVLVAIETGARRQAHYFHTTQRYRDMEPWKLGRFGGAGVSVICCLPLLLGFVVPASIFIGMTLEHGDRRAWELMFELASNSLTVALISACLVCLLALMCVYAVRVTGSKITRAGNYITGLGYAIPGGVIAIGVVACLLRWETWVIDLCQYLWGWSPGLFLSGSIVALLLGYQTRFLAIGLNLVQSGFARISPSMDSVGSTLGATPLQRLLRIHFPLVRGSLLAALLFVFVEVIKELPATLILRPFNFETLAVRVYQLASDERLPEASTSALIIILVGLAPVVILSRLIDRSRPGLS